MRRRAFERLVLRALDQLPQPFKARLENVDIIVEDWPAAETLHDLGMEPDELLFGYYTGTPATDYWRDEGMFGVGASLPDRIYLFKGPIEEVCSGDEEIVEEVRKTVIHEIGHFFGLSEEQVEHL